MPSPVSNLPRQILFAIAVLVPLLFSPGRSAKQDTFTLNYSLTARVDTTRAEVKNVLKLWIDYLSSNPDSVRHSPYWNERENKKFSRSDLAARFIYQVPSRQLLTTYEPVILAIEKESDSYSIRTLFYAEGLKPPHKSSNPWCILRVYAVQEKGKWKLQNALPVVTRDWNRTEAGNITFVYPPSHTFNPGLADSSVALCDSVVRQFDFPDWKPFEFYVTNSKDEMGMLLGFEYYFAGITTGVSDRPDNLLFSGFGSEWYPHELVHMLTPVTAKTHAIINEGLATWLGGQTGLSYRQSLTELAQTLKDNDDLTFDDILSGRNWISGAYYTSGGIICEMVYRNGGKDAIHQLLNSGADNQELYAAIYKLLGLDRIAFEKAWRARLLDPLN